MSIREPSPEKAPGAFRTISEVAEDLDVPQHVLRFWETRFAQIRPMKRGGGRRYYRPEDVDLLRGIRHLLYGEGYTIRGVQRILKAEGVRAVMGAWRSAADLREPAGSGALPRLPYAEAPADDGSSSVLEALAAVDALPDEDETPIASLYAPKAARDEAEMRADASPSAARGGLAAHAAARLEKTLSDLAECKRLLDRVRAGDE